MSLIRRRFHLLVLGLSGLMAAGITTTWILADDSFLYFSDSGNHHVQALSVARVLGSGEPGDFWNALEGIHAAWPPGVFVVHGVLGFLLDDGFHALRLYNLLYIPLILWGVYRLGRCHGDRRTATLAAVLTLFAPGVAFHLRHVCIDNPAMVFVVLGMIVLARGEYRRSLAHTALLFGVVSGLAMLFRVQYLFFVAAPALWIVVRRFHGAPGWRERGRLAVCMVLFLVVTLLLSSLYWATKTQLLLTALLTHAGLDVPATWIGPVHTEEAHLGAGLVYYLLAPGKLAGWPMIIAILATLPILLHRSTRARSIALWIAGGILATAATVGREPRYLLPLVPGLALLAALGIQQLSHSARKAATTAILLATVLPTLLIAGRQDVKEDHWNDRLFHDPYIRAPLPLPSKTQARDIAAAVRSQIPPGAPPRAACLFLDLPGARSEIMSYVSPELPDVDVHNLVVQRDANDFEFWKNAHPRTSSCLLISTALVPGSRKVWKGEFHGIRTWLMEVQLPELKSVFMKPRRD